MPPCSFTLQHAGTPETLFPVAQQEVANNGGSITGSPASGNIRMPTPAGVVALNYVARGSSLAITVIDKPMLASCARIQSGLLELLAKVPAPTPIDVPGESGPMQSHVTVLPPVEIIGETSVPDNPQGTRIKWMLGIGIAAALGTGLVLAHKPRRRTARYRRSTKA
jgi:hypothetical protein